MESKEQISRMVEEELGRAKHKREWKEAIVRQKYNGRSYKELTKEEQNEYHRENYKRRRDAEKKRSEGNV